MARVILADDEPTHLELVTAILERAGHEVVAVGDGKACLDLLAKDSFHLVVTDIFMPNLDGFQLMAAIRAHGNPVPVIGMTGGMNGRVAPFTNVMSRLGAYSILTKPFSADQLLAAVRSALNSSADS